MDNRTQMDKGKGQPNKKRNEGEQQRVSQNVKFGFINVRGWGVGKLEDLSREFKEVNCHIFSRVLDRICLK